ncbi:DUF349 domain-containing protein [Kaistella flava (ex Peng et al. 2021)]|uniref:DUF349 domain-containing protein n=1 Tax=Kaistella flava (ex Peng et al. 2021) TaxID=2038776 RepID=A0A7M2Y5T5_9FLAO|nr:DUF349 domain-containing protein [Kaistella flava (ex Peng et al. 2021)]QOW09024.1 DUF349 domain-containing protein [Kaistella flava (ex Peng et al. 2021)]
MITEDSLSENHEKEPINQEILNETPSETSTATETETPVDAVIEEPKETEKVEEAPAEVAPIVEEQPSEEPEAKAEEVSKEESKTVVSEKPAEKEEEEHHEEELEDLSKLSLPEVLTLMEAIVNKEDAGAHFRKFNQLKEQANHLIHHQTEDLKSEFVAAGNPVELFSNQHPSQAKLSGLLNIYREKNDEYHKKQEENHHINLEHRQTIIENLKNLYTNTEAGTNLFKAIREIKEDWKNAGQVAKSEFKLLNNNYFHHLNQFYQMLDMNKEYMEQEFAHNLEKRQHIIERAKELQLEPSVQKALNELQYLHKLWKEEAEPVAEEFREKTWDEFKEISNKIHDRKSELTEQIEKEQNDNLARKNEIIGEIKKMAEAAKETNHNYWQNSIKKVEALRTEFLKLGNVPRKVSNQNWNDFKEHLRNFNVKKNEFYKGLKNSQQTNLDEKLKLITTAKDNMLSEEWDIIVPLFKKLQEDWKKIGHVPRSMTNKVWDDFREACNTFFNNYREKNNAANDNWKENFKNKKALLEELKEIGNEEGSVEKIEQIKSKWNNIGKVPREKITINTEFNKVLRDKLKLNKIHEYDLKEEGLSENQVTDKARKIKNQIADLEAEIVKMENNLGFFSNSSRENPLLKDTYEKIDDKKSQLESMKQSLHSILIGENQ